MPPAESLAGFLDRARARVDAKLAACLPVPPACPPLINEALRYSVLGGGKRLRPILALAVADAIAQSMPASHVVAPRIDHTDALPGFGPAVALALPAACALELIHTYSLIHDDLPAMDNDTLRRGRPTLHVMYGDGIAILAGDALQAEAFALLAREPVSRDPAITARKVSVLQTIAEAAGAIGMVGGQVLDLQAAGQVPGHALTLDATALQAMHQRKTGALIRASAVSGALMAGADEGVVTAVANWATEIGLAFQIVDDILDVEGTATELGKSTGKDAAGDKPTYPSIFGVERSRTLATDCAERARAILGGAQLTRGWLGEIADWVITRKN